jgi:hypothetical protein
MSRSDPWRFAFHGSLGTLPSEQGWGFLAIRGVAEQEHTGSAARLVTTANNSENAGYARASSVPLARDPGFNLALRIRLHAESHASLDRAGFSVIVLTADRLGIELGFWTNVVFAQAAEPLFTHAEEASFDFTSGFTDLVLNVTGTNYTLFANRESILSGPVRDYTSFAGFPDVYETPDFLFLGDNTGSAAADVEIESVALVFPPRLILRGLDEVEWVGVPGQIYTIESSQTLSDWIFETSVLSTTATFTYTNVAPPGLSRFLRVTHP